MRCIHWTYDLIITHICIPDIELILEYAVSLEVRQP